MARACPKPLPYLIWCGWFSDLLASPDPVFLRQPCMLTTLTPSAKLLQLLPEAVVQTDALWEILI